MVDEGEAQDGVGRGARRPGRGARARPTPGSAWIGEVEIQRQKAQALAFALARTRHPARPDRSRSRPHSAAPASERRLGVVARVAADVPEQARPDGGGELGNPSAASARSRRRRTRCGRRSRSTTDLPPVCRLRAPRSRYAAAPACRCMVAARQPRASSGCRHPYRRSRRAGRTPGITTLDSTFHDSLRRKDRSPAQLRTRNAFKTATIPRVVRHPEQGSQ